MQLSLLDDKSPGDPNYAVVYALIGLGIFYSNYAAILWPCLPMTVKENIRGAAFGFNFTIEGLGKSTVPVILGIIHDHTSNTSFGYYWTEIFLFLFAIAGIVNVFFINQEDNRIGRVLNGNSNKIKEEITPLLDSQDQEMNNLKHEKN